MAEPKENLQMEKIVSLCKRRGFIYQSSEIYGGINGFWDYGPLGAELKRNVKELWWNTMTRQRDDVVGLEATIIMSPQIWKASGHVDTFADLMCECKGCNKRYRTDQVEPQSGILFQYSGAEDGSYDFWRLKLFNSEKVKDLVPSDEFQKALEESARLRHSPSLMSVVQKHLIPSNDTELVLIGQNLVKSTNNLPKSGESYAVMLPPDKPQESADKKAIQFYQKRGLAHAKPIFIAKEKFDDVHNICADCGSVLGDERPFNLMFKTYVGPVESEDNVAYLRPETAQAIFVQFKNVLETSRQKVPFGIAQVGKAFRNEVTPRNYTFRSREFEQMELEFFIKPDEVVEAISGKVASAAEIGNRQLAIGNADWGWEAWHKYWVEERVAFYEGIGLPRNTLVEYWQKPDELAHYARATVDILYKFPFSKRDENGELKGEELEGIAARSDFDLSQHERFSGKPMGVFDEELRAAWTKLDEAKQKELWQRYYEARLKYLLKTGPVSSVKGQDSSGQQSPSLETENLKLETCKKMAREDADGLAKGQYIPHVIEPSAGVDRLILALICNAYYEDQMPDEKGKMETRVVMKFHPRVAPIKVAVLPLLKNKPDLVKKAKEVRDLLRPHMNAFYDDAGAIGRRYRRQDEAGTPFCVTIDFDTLGEKPELLDTVTVRFRDDGKQERLAVRELLDWLLVKIR
ncbi:MAG TPA: glycine--tRNA ligase [Verrucomicrobiae bacterium]|nr:glycine--tRNA ligase [Verrucomicrobiae bacterium]